MGRGKEGGTGVGAGTWEKGGNSLKAGILPCPAAREIRQAGLQIEVVLQDSLVVLWLCIQASGQDAVRHLFPRLLNLHLP